MASPETRPGPSAQPPTFAPLPEPYDFASTPTPPSVWDPTTREARWTALREAISATRKETIRNEAAREEPIEEASAKEWPTRG